MSRIVLLSSASVALYKACDLASKLAQDGNAVRTVLTEHAAELVSPQLFEAVTGEPAFTSEFDASRRGAMDHIDLSEWAELLLCAPMSTDLAGRLANGLATDLPSTVVLATPAGIPRLACPAMNPNMLAHPAVRRNLTRLAEDGWEVMEPDEGYMACGVEGRGRLPEPAAIVARARELLGA